MAHVSDIPKFVCDRCIGDDYLKDEIRRGNKSQKCMICGKKRSAVGFDELCERVHSIIENEYQTTSDEPEGWGDWERDGDDIELILGEILESDGKLIEAIKAQLSDLHYSYDDAKIGEEDPYGDEVRYVLRRSNDYGFQDDWSHFETEIRTRARFFSKKAESVLDGIFGELDRFASRGRSLIRDAGPGTATEVIFRARRATDNFSVAKILKSPAQELGAPPASSAASGRMNPRWISMFYGAFDADTCIAEVRAAVGSSVVIGRFRIIRPLRLLDLQAFKELFVDRASFFDPDYKRLREKARFLGNLVTIMSRPTMPSDEDFQYLPTQAVAEYLSEKLVPKLDGLIFPSSQRDGQGENVVLFQRAAGTKADGTENLESRIDFGWIEPDDEDLDISVWTKVKQEVSVSLDSEFEPPEPHNLSIEEPALQIDLETLEVRDIKAVTYSTATRRVRQYKKTDLDPDF